MYYKGLADKVKAIQIGLNSFDQFMPNVCFHSVSDV